MKAAGAGAAAWVVLVAGAALTGALEAQERATEAAPAEDAPDPELVAVATLMSEGETDRARARLEEWFERSGVDAGPVSLEWSLWLGGRLSLDADRAVEEYQRLVDSYPFGRFANPARMRLAQAAEARGDLSEAVRWARDLMDSGPDSASARWATLWMASHRMATTAEVADPPAGGGREEAPPAAAAEGGSDDPGSASRRVDTGRGPEDAGTPEGLGPRGATGEGEPESDGPFAVQIGAYLSTARAIRMSERLEEAGFRARIVRVPGSPLFRVRTGRFGTPDAARGLAQSVEASGFATFIIGDGPREEPVPVR